MTSDFDIENNIPDAKSFLVALTHRFHQILMLDRNLTNIVLKHIAEITYAIRTEHYLELFLA